MGTYSHRPLGRLTARHTVAGEVGGRDEEAGSRRETFFANQLKSAGLAVRIPTRGDFLVEL